MAEYATEGLGEYEEAAARIKVLTDAIQDALTDLGKGEYVTKWVAVVEVLEPETGHKKGWMLQGEGQMIWDTEGLVTFADNELAAAQVRSALGG
jgi:hypothetical protein